MKLIIASLLVFSFIIIFLFALFPSDISVTRIVQINRPKMEVRNKIVDLREWKNWNELLANGPFPDIANSHSDRSDSNHLSMKGVSVELLKAGPDSVFTRWEHVEKHFNGNFVLTEMNGRTVLQWTLYFHVKWYPWEKLASMFYDKHLGPQMENSLIKLRNDLEAH